MKLFKFYPRQQGSDVLFGMHIFGWYVDVFTFWDGRFGLFCNTGRRTYWVMFGKARIRREM